MLGTVFDYGVLVPSQLGMGSGEDPTEDTPEVPG